MKKSIILTFAILFILSFGVFTASSNTLNSKAQAEYRAEKIETGYWVIEARTSFNTKVMFVAFNHPNTGTKKIDSGQQVMGIQVALYNPGEEDIKVRRNDFLVDEAKINHFIVQEKTTQQLVVTVPAGKSIGITNYYIVDAGLQDIQSFKVFYTSVDKTLKKIKKIIPLTQEK